MLPPPRLRVGPSGWDYPQWQGIVYPLRPPRRLHRLEYLSRYFDTVEIESTFRQPVRTEISRLWLDRVKGNPRFQFTAVLGRQFTHERRLDAAEVSRFKEGLWPLHRAGRLGCLVLQFPWVFRFTVENREFLIQLRRAFHEFPMAAELRHRSWLAEEALGTLIDYRLGFVNIDQLDYTSATPPTALLTTGVGYVRLHGRDPNYWVREFRAGTEDGGLDNYLYSPAELGQWRERIQHVHAHATSTFVIAANPAGGKSVVNALQLSGLLDIASGAETLHRAVA
ncbi:MAG: DUF72 domain-containing protein [Acidobacteriales bacterium]|nr:MAG: DUF72 domain-containing protein [Terriglobales bacterium]